MIPALPPPYPQNWANCAGALQGMGREKADWRGLVISEAGYFVLGDGILELAPGFLCSICTWLLLLWLEMEIWLGIAWATWMLSAPMTAVGLKIGHCPPLRLHFEGKDNFESSETTEPRRCITVYVATTTPFGAYCMIL